mmetsp:Transcript_53919/g.135513  ORF Transcript_53919/g.135513 Transcript_53919/m.135513 type:complete len:272 (-) Transcript_53919:127-942(-)
MLRLAQAPVDQQTTIFKSISTAVHAAERDEALGCEAELLQAMANIGNGINVIVEDGLEMVEPPPIFVRLLVLVLVAPTLPFLPLLCVPCLLVPCCSAGIRCGCRRCRSRRVCGATSLEGWRGGGIDVHVLLHVAALWTEPVTFRHSPQAPAVGVQCMLTLALPPTAQQQQMLILVSPTLRAIPSSRVIRCHMVAILAQVRPLLEEPTEKIRLCRECPLHHGLCDGIVARIVSVTVVEHEIHICFEFGNTAIGAGTELLLHVRQAYRLFDQQ